MIMSEFLTLANIFVSSAEVTGFVEIKKSASSETGSDYLFVVEVTWSDERTIFVKRTYKDFLNFRQTLVSHFKNERRKLLNPVFIPDLQGLKLFRWYTRQLAEERETELHHFVITLLKQNPMISSHPIVVDFFEPRPTDPVPYRTSPDGDSMDEDDAYSEDVFSRKWVGKDTAKCNI